MSVSDIKDLLIALAPYVLPPLIAVLVYLVKRGIDRLPANQRSFVAGIVHTSVMAADQLGDSSMNGPGKRQVALELIEQQLAHYHIDVPAPVINALLEGTVKAFRMAEAETAAAATPPVPAASSAEKEK